VKFIVGFIAVSLAAATAWNFAIPVLEPGAPGAFDETAVKDPSIVHVAGEWHIFYTARGTGQYSLGYVGAPELTGLRHAARSRLPFPGYAAAPQVFYFRPQARWYLVYQTTASNYQPVYSTNGTLDPASWTSPRPLAQKAEKDKWIDFWVICDDRWAWLFYTRNQSEVWAMNTPIGDFPAGFGRARKVLDGVHEAVHIYKDAQNPGFAMLFEVNGEGGWRHFGLARAGELAGPWQIVDSGFAARIEAPPSAQAWSRDISHGELIRTGVDERLEAEVEKARFLVQGMPAIDHHGEYPSLPWRLGLIQNY
jgi:hypothetical protein